MKLVKTLFLFTLVLAMLAGCTAKNSEPNKSAEGPKETKTSNKANSSNTAEAGVTEIEFAHSESGDNIEKLVEEYHKRQNKVRVKAVHLADGYDALMEKLQARAVTNQFP